MYHNVVDVYEIMTTTTLPKVYTTEKNNVVELKINRERMQDNSVRHFYFIFTLFESAVGA